MAERQRFSHETNVLMQSGLEQAATTLFAALDESFKELTESTGWGIAYGHRAYVRYVARLGGISLAVISQMLYANTCDGSLLVMRLFDGVVLTPQEEAARYVFEQPSGIGERHLGLSRTPELGWCLVVNGEPRSIQDTAAFIVEQFVEAQGVGR